MFKPLSALFVKKTATTEIYTLSLHDALPISLLRREVQKAAPRLVLLDPAAAVLEPLDGGRGGAHRTTSPRLRRVKKDRKSTRLNSSHPSISYAVFCLKKKKKLATITCNGNGL